MNHSRWRSHLTALLTALIACVGLLSLSSAPAWAKAGTITEFPTPAGSVTGFPAPQALGEPQFITAGPDGNLWFTARDGNKIGRITPSGAIIEFPLPKKDCRSTNGCQPQEITAGPDGNLWFTERAGNQIGRITTSGSLTEFLIPTPSSLPEGITVGPDGNLWFTEFNIGNIGRITTAGLVTEFHVSTSGP